MRVSHFSHVQLFVAPRTVAHQVPPSMKFPRQEYQISVGMRLYIVCLGNCISQPYILQVKHICTINIMAAFCITAKTGKMKCYK